MSLSIDLPPETEQRLRDEAARRSASVEALAAKLLTEQLRYPIPAELDVSDEEAQSFVDAVHQQRNEPRSRV